MDNVASRKGPNEDGAEWGDDDPGETHDDTVRYYDFMAFHVKSAFCGRDIFLFVLS